MRVLVLAATTGYQTRSFGEAAERLGVELVFATDRCHLLQDPWQDRAIAIKFHDEDASVAAVLDMARTHPIDGVLAVGDRPTVIAARVAESLGLPWHPPQAADAARHKQLTRERLRDANLPVPWFIAAPLGAAASDPRPTPISYPCVVKPVSLSGSRGVIRADTPQEYAGAFERLRTLMRSPEVRAERNDAHETVLVEGFIPGREYAIEALMHRGALQVHAIFDKPEPLDGPFFEETIYVTPSQASADEQTRMVAAVTRAAQAIGLHHGPVHAECRVNNDGVFVLEVAARPIGGLCARALRFELPGAQSTISLEELLLRHAGGEVMVCERERRASGVMMIPIPRRGVYRRVDGLDGARRINGIDDIRVTAKADQLLVPLPEGASYLGFIFARAFQPDEVVRTLRAAHEQLTFAIDQELPIVTAPQLSRTIIHMADSCGPSSPPASGPSTNTSGRKVMCVKFQKELPGLDSPPWPGELGQRIYDGVSKDAWKLWEERMKMILNEYWLMPWQKEAQDLVAKHMEDFFFGDGAALPPGYVPQQAK